METIFNFLFSICLNTPIYLVFAMFISFELLKFTGFEQFKSAKMYSLEKKGGSMIMHALWKNLFSCMCGMTKVLVKALKYEMGETVRTGH